MKLTFKKGFNLNKEWIKKKMNFKSNIYPNLWYMNIAAITITYNDEFKFKEWCDHYEKYKEELYLHIIIDNNSTDDYLKKVKSYFNNSIIIT